MPRKVPCQVCNGAGVTTDRHPHDPDAKDLKCEAEGCERGLVPDETCGSCFAGILIMNGNQIERCDECAIFESDEDAINEVIILLENLHLAYERPEVGSVKAAIDLFRAVALKH